MHPLRDKTAVVGVDSKDDNAVKIGDKIEVVLDPVTPQVTLPRFRLRTER